jgi:hypothetical protein
MNNNEKVILRFKLNLLDEDIGFGLIEMITTIGYRETGQKFCMTFNGSKGYLDNIEISCEGIKPPHGANRIEVANLRTKNGKLQSKFVTIFHSHENGVRVEVTSRLPKLPRPSLLPNKEEYLSGCWADDIPF